MSVIGTSQRLSVENGMGSVPVVTPVFISVLDPDLIRAPTSVQVAVGNADPGASLTFSIDGTDVWTDVADAEGFLGASIPVPGTTTAGSHTITVAADGSSNGTDSDTFTLAFDPPANPVVRVADTDPVLIDGSVGHWVFQDLQPGGLGSWILPISPDSMSSPETDKTVDVAHTTASTGQPHITGAPEVAKPWKVSGYCPNEDFYNHLMAYAAIPRRLYVIDHRGRAWVVAIESIDVQPRRRQSDNVSTTNDWAGTWTMQAYILDPEPRTPAA